MLTKAKRNSKDAIFFSIVIACRNVGKTLDATLRSIRAQSCKHFEVIVVEACSTDDTLQIAQQHQDLITHLISEPDNGIYDAWNKGVALACGSHICFVGGDDTLLPHALRSLRNAARAQPHAHIICGKNHLVTEKGVLLRTLHSKWEWQRFRRHMCIAHVGAAHAKSLFTEYGPFDDSFKITGDYELLLRAGPRLRCVTIDDYVANMTYGGASALRYRALWEAYRCKRLHRATTPTAAIVDLFAASLKLAVRKRYYGIKGSMATR
jgi:glycosyltransferase involved in cell wall biosynthesis